MVKDKVINELKKLSGHEYIELTSRGNTAIFAALYCVRKLNLERKDVLVQAQGGWLTYLKYPKMLERNVVMVKTDHGIIDLKELKKKSKNALALLYQQPAGYFAEQPAKEIYDICKKNDCFVVLDISGSIGDSVLGSYCDISVCSFGRWKPVNLKYGGFLSAKKEEYFEKPKEIFNTTSFDENYLEPLFKKLKNLKKRYEFFYKINKKIKNELKNFDIIHKDKKGINVVVKFKNEAEKEKIINYCKTNNLEYTLCPRYIRVIENAVSIEVKRLEG